MASASVDKEVTLCEGDTGVCCHTVGGKRGEGGEGEGKRGGGREGGEKREKKRKRGKKREGKRVERKKEKGRKRGKKKEGKEKERRKGKRREVGRGGGHPPTALAGNPGTLCPGGWPCHLARV